jgi:hypothetical protein
MWGNECENYVNETSCIEDTIAISINPIAFSTQVASLIKNEVTFFVFKSVYVKIVFGFSIFSIGFSINRIAYLINQIPFLGLAVVIPDFE